uniref:SWIM-type domain-containing protein n=1 Tax=Fagus sylvatica TaxID=28930 RepID=A0A2N9FNG2_FAGSY
MSRDNGLVLLKTDNDVLNMVDVHKIDKFVVLYTVSASDADDCIPLTPTLPEVLVVDKSKGKGKGKGKETGISNKRDKLPIIGRKTKYKGIKITNRQPPVKGKEKEVAGRSKGKGKEKMFEVSVEKEYDADDDIDCGDFDNDNDAGLEVEDEDSELDLWDGLLSGDEDLLDAATTDEEKGPKPKSVEFDVMDMSNSMSKNGMKFADVYQFKEVVRDEMTFQIKTYNPNHTCTRAYKNSQITPRWIAERYMETFRHDIQKPTIALPQQIKGKWNVDVSRMQVYRARKMATENIQGSHKEQYKKIWDYCETLKETNVGITTLLDVERPYLDVAATFQRLYVCLAATRTGFKDGCRPLIGLDGCFLKGSYKGHLLSAVSRDANDNMYPICVAIMESECKASWSWFLFTLLKDIGKVTGGWTFISDRQKGLTESFKEVCPDMDHRACVRHIYANFRDSDHRGKALKDKLWAAASAYTEFEFNAHMAELKKLLPPAYEYLSKIPVATWSRDKPILTMLDTIRRKLMRRFQVNRASIAKMSGKLCPKIQVKVDKAGVKASECLLMYSREGKYEVDYRQQKFVVNLREKTCGCKKWDISGISCHHAISAILHKGICKKFGHNSRTCPLAKKKKSKTGSKGKKKSAVTVGARTSKKGVVTVGAGTSGQAAACGRLASAGGAAGSVGGCNW